MSVIQVVCTDSNIRSKVAAYCSNRHPEELGRELAAGEQLINDWDTSQVTDMSYIFDDMESFNEDISRWNVANVIDMSYMFRGAYSFNKSLNTWNVANVIDMSNMFRGAYRFNQ